VAKRDKSLPHGAESAPASKPSAIVTFLLDRSSSMNMIKAATIEGFNGYLMGLQDTKDADIYFTFLQFDNISLDKICVATPVRDVPLLNEHTYTPRGGTPLIDSAVKTIRAVEHALTKRSDKPRVVVCIQTDGEENSSREFTWSYLRELIAEKQAAGWEFNFLGAGIDAYEQGAKMGLTAAHTMSYDAADIGATKAAFSGRATSHSLYASGYSANTTFSSEEKLAAGDKYDPAVRPAPTAHNPALSAGYGGALDLTHPTQHRDTATKTAVHGVMYGTGKPTGRVKTGQVIPDLDLTTP
jgi:hypothetical protein